MFCSNRYKIKPLGPGRSTLQQKSNKPQTVTKPKSALFSTIHHLPAIINVSLRGTKLQEKHWCISCLTCYPCAQRTFSLWRTFVNVSAQSLKWEYILSYITQALGDKDDELGYRSWFSKESCSFPLSELLRSTTHLCVKVWTPLVHIQIKHSGASEDAQSCDWSPSVPPC